MSMYRILAPLSLVWIGFQVAVAAEPKDPFRANIRPTPALTPDAERATFKLPSGFEVQLVASEPQIQKPLNLAFDARGRLWVTDTVEYPHAAPADRKGRDSIKVLEDTNGDGRADKITTFADGLNIPMGIYPYKDGAIVFSIPHIWRFRDTDGDGVADSRQRLYGPMGYKTDTHGLHNAFRRGPDGWLYVCHGFNNETTVAGRDGHTVHMQSGNTYRLRLDGSRIEQFTWGQVNPFGMALDPLFNLFTADCHSKPLTQLLRGAYYPSFGKPHDGLGFVPAMMDHTHGSTAISGVAWYSGTRFPRAYRGNLFSGNVMTSRINRNSLAYNGSTITARQEDDFLQTSDPWFRPVDVREGPDGALYVADFYNRIIGHYEVPLDHPGRDHKRGRIWRIVYQGEAKAEPADRAPRAERPRNLATATTGDLLAVLGEQSLPRRLLATDQLSDRIGVKGLQAVRREGSRSSNPHVRAHALWVLFRSGDVRANVLRNAATDNSSLVRVHAFKLLAELPAQPWGEFVRQMSVPALKDPDGFVRRAAADALGRHPHPSMLAPLLQTLAATPSEDTHLRHVVRMAVRNQLQLEGGFAALMSVPRTPQGDAEIANIAVAVKAPAASRWLVQYLKRPGEPPAQATDYLRHAARFARSDDVDAIVALVQHRFADSLDQQVEMLTAITSGLSARGEDNPPSIRAWGGKLVGELLKSVEGADKGWFNLPVNNRLSTKNPWVLQPRESSDGKPGQFLCSLTPGGESLTGRLRSPPFTIPPRLQFYLAGHIGAPGQPITALNFIRLRSAEDDRVLVSLTPPRKDVAQRVVWEFSPPEVGRRAYFEVVDGDYRGGFAWLAVGRFEPPVVQLPARSPQQIATRLAAAAELVAALRLRSYRRTLRKLLQMPTTDVNVCAAVIGALTTLEPDARLSALSRVVNDVSTRGPLREQIKRAVVERQPGAIQAALAAAFSAAPGPLQMQLARSLSGSAEGATVLLKLVADGKASPRLLTNRAVATRLTTVQPEAAAQIKELTRRLPSAKAARAQKILQRRIEFSRANPSLANGAQLFQKHCAACHQIQGKGKLIGPQLDGIGKRGVERLIEDLVDPNRNVDAAFRTTTLALTDGKVVSGLVRRKEGATLVLANPRGEEFRVAEDTIDAQSKTAISLMPENLADPLSAQEFADLVGFLSQPRKPPSK